MKPKLKKSEKNWDYNFPTMIRKNFLLFLCAISVVAFTGCSEVPATNGETGDADKAAYREAMQAHDETLCEKISESDYKKKCLVNVADFKILIEAQEKNDPALCDKLTDPNKKQVCHLQF